MALGHGLPLDVDAQAALSLPLDLAEAQREQVVGGIDPLTASLIPLSITKHYESKAKWDVHQFATADGDPRAHR